MPNPKKEIRDFRHMTVNFEEAANFLNFSMSSFYRLIETEVIPKFDNGEYILGEVVESCWRDQSMLVGQDVLTIRKKLEAEIKESLRELADYDGDKITRASAVPGN